MDPDPDPGIRQIQYCSSLGVSRLVKIQPFNTLRRFHSSRTVPLKKSQRRGSSSKNKISDSVILLGKIRNDSCKTIKLERGHYRKRFFQLNQFSQNRIGQSYLGCRFLFLSYERFVQRQSRLVVSEGVIEGSFLKLCTLPSKEAGLVNRRRSYQ